MEPVWFQHVLIFWFDSENSFFAPKFDLERLWKFQSENHRAKKRMADVVSVMGNVADLSWIFVTLCSKRWPIGSSMISLSQESKW